MDILKVIKDFFKESPGITPKEDCSYCGGTGLDSVAGFCSKCNEKDKESLIKK